MPSPLHSLIPTKPKENESERRGILRNATFDKQDNPEPRPENPVKTAQELQENIVRKCMEKYGRSASAQSNKSTDENKKDNENAVKDPLARQTVVAFGRTTKLEDTIKGVKPVVHRPPIGSTKDVMELRKTVEEQAQIIQKQQQQIDELFELVKGHDEKYLYLLESDGKLWNRLNSIGHGGSLFNSSLKGLNSSQKQEELPISLIAKPKPVPLDSISLKKQKEPERQHLSIKPVEESPSISMVERYLKKHPEKVKDVAKMVKNASHESESEDDRKDKKRHRNDSEVSSVLEKITVERKVYGHRRVQNQLTSTIDDSLRDLGFYTSPRNTHRRHHQHHRIAPSTPTIHEVTSSESDDGAPVRPSTPVRRPQPRNDRHQPISSIQATHVPDKFSDDELFNSDTRVSPDENRRPRRVADRLKNIQKR